MKRTIRALAVATAATLGLTITAIPVFAENNDGGPGGSGFVPADKDRTPSARTNQPRVVDLAHPVSVERALEETRQHTESDVLELRFSGNGVVGGMFPERGVSAAKQAQRAETVIEGLHDRKPVVSSITFAPGMTKDAAGRVRSALAAAPTPNLRGAPLEENSEPTPRPAPRRAPAPGQDLDEHFPSVWWGDTYRLFDWWPPINRPAYDYAFAWEPAADADPNTFPRDWGMEIGITSYNPDLGDGTRPYWCDPDLGDPDRDFWSATLWSGAVWDTDVPEDAAPYADGQLFLDKCSENSVEFGIGYPRKLEAGEEYRFRVITEDGTQTLSHASAAVNMRHNDCGPEEPNSNCMGLTSPPPPDGFDLYETLVNTDRNWMIPGCAIMADGFEEPVLIRSGEPECPTVRELE